MQSYALIFKNQTLNSFLKLLLQLLLEEYIEEFIIGMMSFNYGRTMLSYIG